MHILLAAARLGRFVHGYLCWLKVQWNEEYALFDSLFNISLTVYTLKQSETWIQIAFMYVADNFA